MVKCSVPHCPSSAEESIHRLPRDSAFGQEWLRAIQNQEMSLIQYNAIRKKS